MKKSVKSLLLPLLIFQEKGRSRAPEGEWECVCLITGDARLSLSIAHSSCNSPHKGHI